MSAAARSARAPGRATAFYARVTQEESAELSLPNQTRRFDEIASEQGWTSRHFVEPQPVHGDWAVDRRPALRELMVAVDQGAIGRVVVRHLDRLGRGRVLEELIDRLSAAGVELWTFDGRQDVRSAAGRLGVRAQAMVGAFEIERTGERIREMKRQKAKAGHYIGPTPFGYTGQARVQRELIAVGFEPDEARRQAEERFPHNSELHVDEVEAPTVRDAFRLYNAGVSTGEIARRLHAAGRRTRAGGPWRASQVLDLLMAPIYAGWVTFDEHGYQIARNAFVPVKDQPRFAGRHTALVTPETFAQAEERWRRGRQNSGPPRRYALTQVMRCAEGHPARGKGTGSGEAAHYVCARRGRFGHEPARGGCDAHGMARDLAEDLVREALTRMLGQPAKLHEALVEGRRRAARPEEPLPLEPPRRTDLAEAIAKQEAMVVRCTDLLIGAAAGTAAEKALLDRLAAAQETLDGLRRQHEAPHPAPPARVYALPAVVAPEEVERFAGHLRQLLDQEGLTKVVGLLGAHHGLVITIVDCGSLRLDLDLDVLGNGRPAHVTWTVAVQREPTVEAWVAEAQRTAPLCACGCGEAIEILPQHRHKGIPTYRHGHSMAPMQEMVLAFNGEGLLTVNQAAEVLGIGKNTLRERVRRGEFPSEKRLWKDRWWVLVPRSAVQGPEPKRTSMTLTELLEGLGMSRDRFRGLVARGVLPAVPRDAEGQPAYAAGDVERYREAIRTWEETVAEELAEEGWMLAQEAVRRFGLTYDRLQGMIERGEVRAERRAVFTERELLVVRVEDLAPARTSRNPRAG
ncbi:MAG TPA: recombinase family protein [Microthrixaceae bacterium]|nr:recombinase family protein [Microthrixaceae bacterium]